MKKVAQSTVALSMIFAISSCNPKKVEAGNSKDTITTKVEISNDTTRIDEISRVESKTIEGKVLEVQNGKDGYTAKIEAKDKEIYFVTISHSNLKNHAQYIAFKVGEELNVTGDFWQMEGRNQITVRSIN